MYLHSEARTTRQHCDRGLSEGTRRRLRTECEKRAATALATARQRTPRITAVELTRANERRRMRPTYRVRESRERGSWGKTPQGEKEKSSKSFERGGRSRGKGVTLAEGVTRFQWVRGCGGEGWQTRGEIGVRAPE